MNARTIAGLVLLGLAAVSFLTDGIPFTKRETVLEVGPIEATAETEDRFRIPAAVGGGALVAGVILLVMGVRDKK